MTLNSFIENLTTIDVLEHVADFRWDLDRLLEEYGVPVFFTAELSDIKFAWFSLRYTNKCGHSNHIKNLALCFDMFGGPRGTWQALNEEIQEIRGF